MKSNIVYLRHIMGAIIKIESYAVVEKRGHDRIPLAGCDRQES